MGLPTDGFSRGKKLLMEQVSAGNFVLEDDDVTRANRVETVYGCTLGKYLLERYGAQSRTRVLIGARYLRAMHVIVEASLRHHICTNCHLQSKIAGAVWFIVRACSIPLTAREIDAAVRIKRCTFAKFAKAIKTSPRLCAIVAHFFPHLRNPGAIDEIRVDG
jgi:hypothetical protein